jgi:Amino acid permease
MVWTNTYATIAPSVLTSSRFSWIVLVAAELVAITHIFQFRYPPYLLAEAGYPDSTLEFHPDVSPSVLVFCFLIVLFLLNMLPVRQFGQMEYIFGLIKMLFIILMIILNVVLQIRQPVQHGPFVTSEGLATGDHVRWLPRLSRQDQRASGFEGSQGPEGPRGEPLEPQEPSQALGLYRRPHGASLTDLHGQLYSIERLVLKLLLATHSVTCPLLLRHRTE